MFVKCGCLLCARGEHIGLIVVKFRNKTTILRAGSKLLFFISEEMETVVQETIVAYKGHHPSFNPRNSRKMVEKQDGLWYNL
jgi:hypothetical protein